MFKPKSGRKVDSGVWSYFVYDASSDKSRCIVNNSKDGDDTQTCECGQLLSGRLVARPLSLSLSLSSIGLFCKAALSRSSFTK